MCLTQCLLNSKLPIWWVLVDCNDWRHWLDVGSSQGLMLCGGDFNRAGTCFSKVPKCFRPISGATISLLCNTKVLSHQTSQSSWFFVHWKHVKRSAFQKKWTAVWQQLPFQAQTVLEIFKKQAPGYFVFTSPFTFQSESWCKVFVISISFHSYIEAGCMRWSFRSISNLVSDAKVSPLIKINSFQCFIVTSLSVNNLIEKDQLGNCIPETTVLLRTPVTQTIFFNQGMLLLCSNHSSHLFIAGSLCWGSRVWSIPNLPFSSS